MKKLLLGTSALIGAATLLAGAALADDPKVTIGGFSTFEAGWDHSDFTSVPGASAQTPEVKNHELAFRNDNEIHFNIAGKTDQGLGYGAEIDLQADINGANDAVGTSNGSAGSSASGIVARRTYGWLQGDQWGHVEYGSNDSAARNLKVDASNIARATGGIDGDFVFFANANTSGGTQATAGQFTGGNAANTNISKNNFITAPRLPVESGPANGFASDLWGNDTKITYYTPRFSGFQLGVSYTPELYDRGELTSTRVVNSSTSGAFGASNIWSGGLNYESQFDQVGVAAAVTGETGKSDDGGNDITNDAQNIQAWNAGAKLSYMGWSIAGSYGDWQDSLATNGTSADYWTGGLAYETGPFGASVTYLGSETTMTGIDNKFQDVSVGVDYKLAPGLTPFIEYTWYDIDPTGSAATGAGAGTENMGNVVIIGSQLSF